MKPAAMKNTPPVHSSLCAANMVTVQTKIFYGEEFGRAVGQMQEFFAIYYFATTLSSLFLSPNCCAAMRGCTRTCFYWILSCAKQAAWASRVQIFKENCILEMPLSRQLVQIISRNKFSIRFESLCWILRVSARTRMGQNQAKSNYKDCSFGNRYSFVKGTRSSILILAKSQAGW